MMALLVASICFLILGSNAWIPDMENPSLYEGDMVLTPQDALQAEQGTFKFSVMKDLNKRWPGAVVPYTATVEIYNSGLAMKAIRETIEAYHKYTCIRFKERTYEKSYIEFYSGFGCNSPVGYRKDEKIKVSISENCWHRSTVIHEVAHALGMHHEQSRPDRNNFVTVVNDNIHPDMYFNFKKQPQSEINSYGVAYDYLSIMHYSWNAFAKNKKKPSIITKDPKYQYHIGQDQGFSVEDVEQLNMMYSCPGPYPTPPVYEIVEGCYNIGGGCEMGADEGNCDKPEWRTFMHSKCARSCKICGNKGPQPTDGPPRTYPVTVPAKTTKNPDCKDRGADCKNLIKFCEKPSWVNLMARRCPKTCNFC